MEELRDIRVLEEIPDISLYLFIVAIIFGALVVGSLLYMVYRYLRRKKESDTRKIVIERLKEVDLSDPKSAAYKITKYARYLADDEQSNKYYVQLAEKLQKYKYAKNVPEFDSETINQYQWFLKVLDE